MLFLVMGGRNPHSSSNFDKPMCQICGKTGHTALKCFHRFDLTYQNQTHSPTSTEDASLDSTSNSQAYIASPNVVNHTTWYLDSVMVRLCLQNLNILEMVRLLLVMDLSFLFLILVLLKFLHPVLLF